MKLIDIFEDQTIPQLRQSTERGFPNTKKRQHSTGEVQVTNIEYQPAPAQKALQITTITTSNGSGNQHNQMVMLKNATFESMGNGSNASFKAVDGKEYYIKPLPVNDTNVNVACDCEDYLMRFAHTNNQNGCHLGPLPPNYVRKTTTRPPANPQNVPGCCKHLLKLLDDLKGYGLLA
jgi:hypothetical protein